MRASVLERTQRVSSDPDEVFAFFADPQNLAAITPPWLEFLASERRAGPVADGDHRAAADTIVHRRARGGIGRDSRLCSRRDLNRAERRTSRSYLQRSSGRSSLENGRRSGGGNHRQDESRRTRRRLERRALENRVLRLAGARRHRRVPRERDRNQQAARLGGR